jgi:hypothetical protein
VWLHHWKQVTAENIIGDYLLPVLLPHLRSQPVRRTQGHLGEVARVVLVLGLRGGDWGGRLRSQGVLTAELVCRSNGRRGGEGVKV